MMVAFSSLPSFDVRLPCGDDDNASSLHLMVVIRDTSDCVNELNMTSVSVRPDSSTIAELVAVLDNSTPLLTTNPVVQLLSGGNQNTVSQILSSLSQQFNTINTASINIATARNYSHN